jgi:hypothetical protein
MKMVGRAGPAVRVLIAALMVVGTIAIYQQEVRAERFFEYEFSNGCTVTVEVWEWSDCLDIALQCSIDCAACGGTPAENVQCNGMCNQARRYCFGGW